MAHWVKYTNGNYKVFFDLDNGSKMRVAGGNLYIPSHPESVDLKITNKCHHSCAMCHENSNENGKHGDILNLPIIETFLPYTELAIGGGNPLEHPDLEAFLYKCKGLKLIANMTIHQQDFLDNIEYIRWLVNERLIYGLGVSISYVTPALIEALQEFPNAVCHIIAGIATEAVINKLAHHNLKILILGYKIFRRGNSLYQHESSTIDFLIQYMYDLLPQMIEEHWFNTISFDNLAIQQLNPSRLMSEEHYSEFFMGDDGSHTFYIDAVNKEFAVSSTTITRHPFIGNENITQLFNVVRKESGHVTYNE